MHELSMCEALLDAVERRAQGRAVTAVRMRIGAVHAVVPEAMDQAFELVSAGTVAEGASLEVITVPIAQTCRACEARHPTQDPLAICPSCGSADVELAGGDELLLESIEVGSPAPEGDDRVSRHPG